MKFPGITVRLIGGPHDGWIAQGPPDSAYGTIRVWSSRYILPGGLLFDDLVTDVLPEDCVYRFRGDNLYDFVRQGD